MWFFLKWINGIILLNDILKYFNTAPIQYVFILVFVLAQITDPGTSDTAIRIADSTSA